LTSKAIVRLNLIFSEANKVDDATQYGTSSFIGWIRKVTKSKIVDTTRTHHLKSVAGGETILDY